ncbi:MAG TPA: FtsX-like permease family protein, partial [Gemmatimonadales bacterium]|nr:FtsX-like permease family protein [Gemmatimonadales bacterium]
SGVIGRPMTVRGAAATIIGVLPPDFSYLGTGRGELFAPKVLDTAELRQRGPGWYSVVGRLKPGVTLAGATADLNRVARQLAVEYPATNAESGVTLVPLRDGIVGGTRSALLLLFAGVGIVLLIACINVGSLVAAETGRREREFAIRSALGARRLRVARQLLAECLVVSAVGGALGVLLADSGVGVIRALAPASLPRADGIRVNVAVLAFSLLVTLATAIAVGLGPAVRAARTDPGASLGSGDRAIGRARRRSLRQYFVGAELALTVMLLAATGLLTRSFRAVVERDWGYRADHVIGATLFVWRSTASDAARIAFVRRLVDRVSEAPGVANAGVVSNLPLMEPIGLDYVRFAIAGQPVTPGAEPTVHVTSLTPGAFATLGARLRGGRWFSSHDDSGATRVAIISESLARRFWSGQDPLGRSIRVGYYGPPVDREVVGIVDDVPTTALDGAPQPTLYLPYDQAVTGSFAVVARSTLEPAALLPSLRGIIADIAPGLPVAEVHTLDALMAESLRPRRFVLSLFGCFSFGAFALMLVGVYGAVTQSTVERTRELAIRLAVGAEPRAVVTLVMIQGVTPAVAGLAAGWVGAAALTRTIQSMLFGVAADDVVTLAAVSVLVLVAATLASYLPASRAAHADPLPSLRSG